MSELTQIAISSEPLGADGALVAVAGELDIATADPLRDALAQAVADGARRLVVDLRDVGFLDSVAVAVLVHASRRVDGRFAVAIEPGSYVRMIFEIAGLLDGLGVRESLDEALARVAVAG